MADLTQRQTSDLRKSVERARDLVEKFSRLVDDFGELKQSDTLPDLKLKRFICQRKAESTLA